MPDINDEMSSQEELEVEKESEELKKYQKQFEEQIKGIEDVVRERYLKIVSDKMLRSNDLAVSHVDFLLDIMRPLMIAEFIHGYKHGLKEVFIK